MSERMLFDLSGIDRDDDESFRDAPRRIWEIILTRM
jgi:hypothetical protein